MAELNTTLFSAADNLRSKMDASEYKNYLLGLIFYKYLSDRLLEKVVELADESLEEYDTADKQTQLYRELLADVDVKDDLIETLVDTLGYDIEPDYLFNVLTDQAKQNTFQLNDLNKAFIDLSTKYDQFNGLFDDVDLTSKKLGSDPQQRNITITEVIKKLNPINLLGHGGDVIGDAYEFLISQFASEAGKKAGEFYTPHEVSVMMARIAAIGQEDKKLFSVYDPTMGSGSLMLNVRNYINHPESVKYHGQELNTTTYNLAKMNLILHGVDKEDMRLSNGDTLNKDWPTEEPYTFDSVLMNPPYSAKWSADDTFMDDSRFNRYGRLAPKSKADFAFLLHGLYHLKDSGTMAIVLPHGVLFRGAAEGIIRKKLLEDGNIDAVIGMPANMFFGTNIPTTVLILKKNRTTRDVLFIDASKEFVKGKNQNKLINENINKIVDAYNKRENIEKYAYLAAFEEIKENEFNLNIPRYVNTFEVEEPIDMALIGSTISDIRNEKSELKYSLHEMISTLHFDLKNEDWIKGALEVFNNEE
ncbi:type I restriction-modification system subunit M [Sporosarcina sp. P2]|uniref:type I restriction-modification system subunit M n=1 Tax=Sporosarcina sp. P2 TaxID=2048251 RepID=UPI000C16EAA2|nr:type I restriction-modification system subunit M [Sporosarcina sp. P2]PID03004.1 type I restriction-modification system subunit M [Sporosarcina sp. P2]